MADDSRTGMERCAAVRGEGVKAFAACGCVLFLATRNSQLRTDADSGNPTV